MKQFRVVYQYKRDTVRGAGAAFVIATDEIEARRQLELAMPGVEPIDVKEEHDDPLRVYERPVVLSVVRAVEKEAFKQAVRELEPGEVSP